MAAHYYARIHCDTSWTSVAQCMLAVIAIIVLLTPGFGKNVVKQQQSGQPYNSIGVDGSARAVDGGTNNVTSDVVEDQMTGTKGMRTYRAAWSGNRRWVGPHWWANPMYDWRLRGDSVLASAAADRNLCFLPIDVTQSRPDFTLSVGIRMRASKSGFLHPSIGAGFIVGRRSTATDFRRALLMPTTGVKAVVKADGQLVLGRVITRPNGLGRLQSSTLLRLTLTSKAMGKVVQLTLSVEKEGMSQPAVVQAVVPLDAVTGGVALFSDGQGLSPQKKRTVSFTFTQFVATAHENVFHDDRTIGPIVWTQYSLNANTLRIQAQLMPVESGVSPELWVSPSLSSKAQFRKETSVRMDKASFTATFTVNNWIATRPHRYEVRLLLDGRVYVWSGRIRREPRKDEPLKMGVFSCDRGYVFPHSSLVEQVQKQNPDILFFLGDQIYEAYGSYGVALFTKTDRAVLDFLYKFMRFGLTWRDVLSDRPSVIIPDDHDVYHPNLWGDGGRAMRDPQARDWSSGGYIMPGKWLQVVEKIHVGHLPEPAVDITLSIGTKPYFTSFVYGSVGFAVLEDRKFKSPPGAGNSRRNTGTNLLGSAQEAFLAAWTRDWTSHTMKIAVSQTAFAKVTTHAGPRLQRVASVVDSGSWPHEPRNRVVKLLGDANVFTMHGDQHLGILFQQGINQFHDAGYSFVVPGIANGFPRAWWPHINNPISISPGQKFTGQFIDDAGNPLTILAVANPDPNSGILPFSGTDPQSERVAYQKASGFGIVDLDKSKKSARVNLFRIGGNGEQFDGFPQTVIVGGRPTGGAAPQRVNSTKQSPPQQSKEK